MDGMGDQGRTVKYEYKKNKVMKKLEVYYPIILAFISFLFSVTLWFTGFKDEGVFVGIWVPSILGLATFFNTLKQ
jgi:ABC-type multidrug transport system permease subunit